MRKLSYTIILKSDAELSSGQGNEKFNSLLPRGKNNCVIIPASHLKGIMRENLLDALSVCRADGKAVVDTLFGNAPDGQTEGQRSAVNLTSADALPDAKTIAVTRTAIDENGQAVDGSLRTTEALSAGSILSGTATLDSDDDFLFSALRFSLLSITSIGGGRTRGAGNCRVKIAGCEKETPGSLLLGLADGVFSGRKTAIQYIPGSSDSDEDYCACKLIFEAEQPICLPSHPVAGNKISSGFTIPGTAVAGTLLTILSEKDNELASRCYRSPHFRCFPLLPVGDTEDTLMPVRISNSHKISKLKIDDDYLFGDQMIPDDFLEPEDYHWERKTSGLAMKGTDGVLLVKDGKSVKLLRANDIPRFYSAHGVVNGIGDKADNLYTMESVCAKRFESIVILPVKAAGTLKEMLGKGRHTAFGKSKSVLGGGNLKIEDWNAFQSPDTLPQVAKVKNRLFIVQTPIVFDTGDSCNENSSTFDIMKGVLNQSGWGELEKESVMTSILFGWNELKIENQIEKSGRVHACRVILPGSVFLLKKPVENLREKMAAGLGVVRTPGYGAVLPHPMFADKLAECAGSMKLKEIPPSPYKNAVYKAYELHKKAGKKLSASQIAHLMRTVQSGTAMEFLRDQKLSRPKQIWDNWEPVYNDLEDLTSMKKDELTVMLRVWIDLRNGKEN